MGEVPFFEKDKGQVKKYYILYYILYRGLYIYIYGAERLSFVLSGQNRSNLMRVNLLREYFPLVLPVLPVLTRLSSASLCIELERDVSNLTGREALSFLQKKTPEAEQVYPRGHTTMHQSEHCGDYTKPPVHVKIFVRLLARVYTRPHVCTPHPQIP